MRPPVGHHGEGPGCTVQTVRQCPSCPGSCSVSAKYMFSPSGGSQSLQGGGRIHRSTRERPPGEVGPPSHFVEAANSDPQPEVRETAILLLPLGTGTRSGPGCGPVVEPEHRVFGMCQGSSVCRRPGEGERNPKLVGVGSAARINHARQGGATGPVRGHLSWCRCHGHRHLPIRWAARGRSAAGRGRFVSAVGVGADWRPDRC